jgi:hypothetical protein
VRRARAADFRRTPPHDAVPATTRRRRIGDGNRSRSTPQEAPMIIDRYVKVVLTVIAVALVMLAARAWLPETTVLSVAHAQSAVPKYEVTVPKAWGQFVAFSNNNLLLRAPDDTMRIVDVEGKAPEYPRIKALIRWQ